MPDPEMSTSVRAYSSLGLVQFTVAWQVVALVASLGLILFE